jgi:hypothetical protein
VDKRKYNDLQNTIHETKDWFNPITFCVCSRRGPGFPTQHVVFFFFCSMSWGKKEVIVRFVDISGIVYHHCIKFIFIFKPFCGRDIKRNIGYLRTILWRLQTTDIRWM